MQGTRDPRGLRANCGQTNGPKTVAAASTTHAISMARSTLPPDGLGLAGSSGMRMVEHQTPCHARSCAGGRLLIHRADAGNQRLRAATLRTRWASGSPQPQSNETLSRRSTAVSVMGRSTRSATEMRGTSLTKRKGVLADALSVNEM